MRRLNLKRILARIHNIQIISSPAQKKKTRPKPKELDTEDLLLKWVNRPSIRGILSPCVLILLKPRYVLDELIDAEPNVLRRLEDVERDIREILERAEVLADVLNEQFDELSGGIVGFRYNRGVLSVVDEDRAARKYQVANGDLHWNTHSQRVGMVVGCGHGVRQSRVN